jgi:pilus assembly protein Flp/PilA
MALISRFRKDRSGATAIEYGLIAALISIAIVVGARAIGVNIGAAFYGPIANALG